MMEVANERVLSAPFIDGGHVDMTSILRSCLA